ncbi:MAG: HD domain-containing protein [Opitutales bacterium]|jgi:hypothetical protein
MNSSSYSLLEPDTRNVQAVADAIEQLHAKLFPGVSCAYVRPFMVRVEDMFAGRYRDFQAMDTAYHDLEHTLQATLCCLRIVTGHQRAGATPHLGPHDFRIGCCAMLLHDVGYLKKQGDNDGTGAKYTLTHESRGCDIAREVLPEDGWLQEEIERVCSLILCTGPRSNLGGTKFGNPAHRTLGEAVCTADFLSQMSDPGYVQKLPDLFEEFAESDRINQVPLQQRVFKTVDDLYRNTPAFWENFVLHKLRGECHDIARYLADPYPDGPNPYLLQVKENIEAVRRIVALSDGDLSHLAKHMG